MVIWEKIFRRFKGAIVYEWGKLHYRSRKNIHNFRDADNGDISELNDTFRLERDSSHFDVAGKLTITGK